METPVKTRVRRIKKGEVVPMQAGQSGYVATPAPERGYFVTVGGVSAFVPDSVFKEARANGEAVLEGE